MEIALTVIEFSILEWPSATNVNVTLFASIIQIHQIDSIGPKTIACHLGAEIIDIECTEITHIIWRLIQLCARIFYDCSQSPKWCSKISYPIKFRRRYLMRNRCLIFYLSAISPPPRATRTGSACEHAPHLSVVR
jgi:hypothetical protein